MKRLVEVSKKETGSQNVFFKVNPIHKLTGDYLETGFYETKMQCKQMRFLALIQFFLKML